MLGSPTTVCTRATVTYKMVSLRWGDAMAVILPGSVALLALAPLSPALIGLLEALPDVSFTVGFVLLIAAALAGGVLEALTRIVVERLYIHGVKIPARSVSLPNGNKIPPRDVEVLERITLPKYRVTAENLPIYDRGVQASYKYFSFYSNAALATLFLLLSRWAEASWPQNVMLWAVMVVLFRAAYVQLGYYARSLSKLPGAERC